MRSARLPWARPASLWRVCLSWRLWRSSRVQVSARAAWRATSPIGCFRRCKGRPPKTRTRSRSLPPKHVQSDVSFEPRCEAERAEPARVEAPSGPTRVQLHGMIHASSACSNSASSKPEHLYPLPFRPHAVRCQLLAVSRCSRHPSALWRCCRRKAITCMSTATEDPNHNLV